MITNGNSKTLSQISMTVPNVSGALSDWFHSITANIVTKTTVNFQLVESTVSKTFYGMVQTGNPQNLNIKSEGQRAWINAELFCNTDLEMSVDDIITIDSVSYRVMVKTNWAEYGYLSYSLAEVFT